MTPGSRLRAYARPARAGSRRGAAAYADSATGAEIRRLTGARADDTGHAEAPVHGGYTRFQSNTAGLVAGDSSRSLPSALLWEREADGAMSDPRKLARHDCSVRARATRVHATLAPGGDRVAFASDRSGYGNVYVAEVPENCRRSPLED